MIKIAMIGCGKLGLPCAEQMALKHDVVGYDIVKFKSSTVKQKKNIKKAIKNRDIIFIAVPTPHCDEYDGSYPTSHLPVKDFDYSIVKDVLIEIKKHIKQNQLIVLISTVLPGTIRSLFEPIFQDFSFIYNPYLIAMGSVAWDMVNPEMVIIGTKNGNNSDESKELIEFYKTIMQNNPRYEVGTWEEAESIKIFYNTFITTKITFVNMIQDVAVKLGNMNVDTVTKALANSTQRLISDKYMTAGMGDGGACLHPETYIYTSTGAKQIKDIKVDDYVLSGSGKFNRVSAVHKNLTSNVTHLLKIKADRLPPLMVTDNHDIYVSDDLSESTIVKKVQAKDLKDHYLIQPVPLQNKATNIPEYVNSDYLTLLGYYITEGSIKRYLKSKKPASIRCSLNINEDEYIQEILDNPIVNGNGRVTTNKNKSSSEVYMTDHHLAEIITADGGVGSLNKNFPTYSYSISNEMLKSVLYSMFRGDGSVNKNRISYSTISSKLANNLVYVLRRFGIVAALSEYKPKNKNNTVYQVEISNMTNMEKISDIINMDVLAKTKSNRRNSDILLKDKFYHKIKKIEKVQYGGDVYDLTVENEHNYVTASGLVSNCHPRDNIALSALSQKLELNYDVFGSLIHFREQQANNMAKYLINFNMPIVIVGVAFKPGTSYTIGSPSLLVYHYIKEHGGEVYLYDPKANYNELPKDISSTPAVYLIAHNYNITYYKQKAGDETIGSEQIFDIFKNASVLSIIVDPWRTIQQEDYPNMFIDYYGNTL